MDAKRTEFDRIHSRNQELGRSRSKLSDWQRETQMSPGSSPCTATATDKDADDVEQANPDRIFGRVFRKLSMLSNTLEQIEAWLDVSQDDVSAEVSPDVSSDDVSPDDVSDGGQERSDKSPVREWMEREEIQKNPLSHGGTSAAENFVG